MEKRIISVSVELRHVNGEELLYPILLGKLHVNIPESVLAPFPQELGNWWIELDHQIALENLKEGAPMEMIAVDKSGIEFNGKVTLHDFVSNLLQGYQCLTLQT